MVDKLTDREKAVLWRFERERTKLSGAIAIKDWEIAKEIVCEMWMIGAQMTVIDTAEQLLEGAERKGKQ